MSAVYEQAEGRSQLVATFLAVLELVKSKRIKLSDDDREVSMAAERKSTERRESSGHS